MKTPGQIKAWLEAQPWYEQFKMNMAKDICYTIENEREVLSGILGKATIVFAFIWRDTDEGFKFWDDIDEELCKWYDEENPD